jgi:hypothetical protein
VWARATTQEINQRPQYPQTMSFRDIPPFNFTASVSEVTLDYGADTIRWVYDPIHKNYQRYENDILHTDTNGNPITTTNVVIVWAHHQPDYTIVESEWMGSRSYSLEIQIWSLGPVTIFRDGLRYDGHWHRWDKNAMLTFWTDETQTTRLDLKPGNSWFEVVPLDFMGLQTLP